MEGIPPVLMRDKKGEKYGSTAQPYSNELKPHA